MTGGAKMKQTITRPPAVNVQDLTKVFRIWRRPSDMLVEAVTGRRRHEEFTALQNVTFDVPRGAVVGVLGRNGAGKSTLLRIIAGTLDATAGRVEVDGRISAILELGTGFHPEYTGRENVYLGGRCLGLSRAEIDERFDEIVAFSELEEFIDQPFRTFSSGMQARLTFAVATSVDPDLLIVDEALSVGDARFALKSFDRIRAFARRNKSILFVSHDINQISTFCDHALILERGRVFEKGEASRVGNVYHELLFGGARPRSAAAPARADLSGAAPYREPPPVAEVADVAVAPGEEAGKPGLPAPNNARDAGPAQDAAIDSAAQEMAADDGFAALFSADAAGEGVTGREHRYGDGGVRIERFYVEGKDGRPAAGAKTLESCRIAVELVSVVDAPALVLGVLFRNAKGVDIYGADTAHILGPTALGLEKNTRRKVVISFYNALAPGHYFVTFALARPDGYKHDLRFDALEFIVAPSDGVYHNSVVNLDVEFDVGSSAISTSPPDKRGAGEISVSGAGNV